MISNPLRRQAFTQLVHIGAFLACLGYWAVLLDWVQAYRTGVYEPLEAVYKPAAHWLYLYLGVRFLRNRIRFF